MVSYNWQFFLQFHSYSASPDAVIQKLRKVEDMNESLQKKLKNTKAREKRCREMIHSIKDELKEKNYLTEELQDRLSSYQGMFNSCFIIP